MWVAPAAPPRAPFLAHTPRSPFPLRPPPLNLYSPCIAHSIGSKHASDSHSTQHLYSCTHHRNPKLLLPLYPENCEFGLLVGMAGLAQTMMNCTAVRGCNASSFMAGSSPLSSVQPAAAAKSAWRMAPLPRISAVKTPEECNDEECAPTKEVGKLSMEWKSEDNTKVSGTFPPINRGTERKWTGYVEKDTAGQTNIYAVEPTIYVADSAISTGAAGSNSGGSGGILAIVGGIGAVAIAGAAAVLLTASKNAPTPASSYDGPPLSYYVSKFSQETSSASSFSAQVPPVPESPPLAENLSISQPEVAVSEAQ